jgi:hypothetical protein
LLSTKQTDLYPSNFNPDDTVAFALPASRLVSVHRGGEMLSYFEAPQVSDLFAAFAGLTLVSLPPHTTVRSVAIDTESIASF